MVEIKEQNCSLSIDGIYKSNPFDQSLSENDIKCDGKQIQIVNNIDSARLNSSNASDLTRRTCSFDTENTTASDSQIISSSSEIHTFGWGKFQPKFIQRFCTVKWALFWLCWGGALQGFIVNGCVNVVITTLERRFNLRSTQTGLVVSGYDIASFFLLLPVSFFGGRKSTSKPKYLAWGVFIMGIGSLVFALPHFLIDPYSATLVDEGVCKLTDPDLELQRNTSIFEEHNSDKTAVDLSWAVWFFFGGQFLLGAGAAPLYTLGVAYIDENVSKKMSSVYLGIYYTTAIIGPAAGYVIGGQFLLIYTDFLVADPSQIGITSDSSVWIGAWWIGFLIGAALCFLLAIPMFAYPKALPRIKTLEEEKDSDVSRTDNDVKRKSHSTLKEFPHELWALLRNPTLFSFNMAAACEALVMAGFAAFLPKVIENQYGLSPMYAALLVGAVTVPAGGGGTYLGGYFVKKFKLTCVGIIKMCVLMTAISTILLAVFLLKCPNSSLAGVTVNYPESGNNTAPNAISFEAPCNSNCNCSSSDYDPICGANNVMYYNPCYAGCQDMMTINRQKIYSNCSCITTGDKEPDQLIPILYEATNSKCEINCDRLWYFVPLLFILIFLAFTATMPLLMATLRCVHNDQRSFALGIQWIKVRIFGSIPAPILFGALIDRSCILWHDGSSSGSCLMFNNHGMSIYIFTLSVIGKSLSLLFFIASWWFYRQSTPVKENSIQETDNSTEKKNDINIK